MVMPEETLEFIQKVQDVELVAEELLTAKGQLVELDEKRNDTRVVLTALRKEARTSVSSVFQTEEDEKCITCGDSDGRRPVWKMLRGADVFVRLPFHQVHCDLENDQSELESDVKRLQSVVKEKSYLLSEKGVISDIISPSLMESFVNLKA